VSALANEVGDYPMLFSLLQMLYGEPSHFCPPETASQEDSYHGVIAYAPQVGGIEYGEEAFSLVRSQPVAYAHTVLLDTFYAPDSRGKIRAKKPQSAASYASLRIAARRKFIVEDA
jgi:hypothetical protein